MTWRTKFLFLFFLLPFFLIIGRLFYWQVIRGSELLLRGLSQYSRAKTLLPFRGEIRSSDNFPIVTNSPGYLVFVQKNKIKDKGQEQDFVNKLSTTLEIDQVSISAALAQDLPWIPIKQRVEKKTKEQIEGLQLPGVGFDRQDFRFYPEASMAAHLTGFVGKEESGGERGYFGLEGLYDRELRGRVGKIREIKDAQGKPILLSDNSGEGKIDGQTLVLHLDRRVQFMAEKYLKEGVERYAAKGGTVAIMDPKTGGILASASYPAYEQDKYTNYSEDQFRDPLISDTYEPGSTFKILVMAVALNERVVEADTKCDSCAGPVTIYDYTIRTWNNKYFPQNTMKGVIVHSDNTGMVFVSKKLGLDKLLTNLKKFGIGQSTGLDLQGESNVPLRPKDKWYPIDLATASFGQGVALTPIQMLTAVSALANGGKLMEPHVVAKIVSGSGREFTIKPRVLREVVSQDTAKKVTDMMVEAVDRGEAKWAKPKGWRIAGKTGTSQVPIKGHYDPDKTVATFIGFAPADDPKFVMLVKINEPTSSPFGSETAAPIFFKIAKELLLYYNIPPKE